MKTGNKHLYRGNSENLNYATFTGKQNFIFLLNIVHFQFFFHLFGLFYKLIHLFIRYIFIMFLRHLSHPLFQCSSAGQSVGLNIKSIYFIYTRNYFLKNIFYSICKIISIKQKRPWVYISVAVIWEECCQTTGFEMLSLNNVW